MKKNNNRFKQTEIGLIPEDWNVVRLGDVAELLRGVSWRKEEANKSGRGLPIIAIPNIGIGTLNFDFRHFLTREVSTKKLLKKGDILFVGSSGSIHNIGRNVLVRFLPLDKISFASFSALIRPEKSEVTSDFLYYLINSKWIDFKKFTKRAADGKYNFQLRDFQSNVTIPLPSLPEQQKIARVLSKIQQAIEQQDKIIEATKNLKKSLMQKLFTEGLGHREFKEAEIGQIPKNWEVVKLEQVCKPRKEIVQPIGEGKIKYIGLEHIDSGKTALQHFGSDSDVRSSKNRFYHGDILYGKLRPYLDKAVVTEFDGICSTDIIVISTNSNKAVSDYIVNLLHLSPFVSYATSTMTGVNHPRTSWKAIGAFKIPLPSLPEQQEIAHILSTIDKKIEAEEKRKTALKELFKTMLNKLMTGKIRLKEIEL